MNKKYIHSVSGRGHKRPEPLIFRFALHGWLSGNMTGFRSLPVLFKMRILNEICGMENTMSGYDALRRAETVTALGGTFTIAFYPYSRAKGEASTELQVMRGCRTRLQMPHEKWSVDGANYFLFDTDKGEHRMCWRVLIRWISFSDDNKLYKLIWYDE